MTPLEKSMVYLIKHQPKSQIGVLMLAKYLYLSDYVFAKTFGNKKTFTGAYTRLQKGPVPSGFYDALSSLTTKKIIKRVGHTILLSNNTVATPDISKEEKACLDKVINDFAGRSLKKVVDAAYSTEPMKNLIAEESSLGGEILLFQKLDFDKIRKHSLLENDKLDTSFIDSEEYKKSVKDE